MSQKRAYKQYSKEFKEEAVALVNDQGYTVPEAAKSLGINPNMLYRWKEKLDESNGRNQVSESERQELLRLRKENRNLRMEKEILKKASVDSIDQCNNHGKTRVTGDLLDEAYVYSNRKRICF